MKVAEKLSLFLKELLRYARWLLRHYEEIAPLIELARRLVVTAEEEGGTGGEKRVRVRRRIGRLAGDETFPESTVNLAIERAVAEMRDGR